MSFSTFFKNFKSQTDRIGVKIEHGMCPKKFKTIEKGEKLNFLSKCLCLEHLRNIVVSHLSIYNESGRALNNINTLYIHLGTL